MGDGGVLRDYIYIYMTIYKGQGIEWRKTKWKRNSGKKTCTLGFHVFSGLDYAKMSFMFG